MAPKPVVKTAVPFTPAQWPDIAAPSQAVILDLLCGLLEPIGQHRQTHIQPSKGKDSARKRKRDADAANAADEDGPPPPPEISNHVLVGLNSVTRYLSALAADLTGPSSCAADDEGTRLTPLSLVILPHPVPSSSLPHAHLPTLVYLSTPKAREPTRLVALASASEARLASMLHIPRVGAIGIKEGAPGAASLVEYVRQNVGLVESKWIEEALKAEWSGVQTVDQTAS